MTAENSRPTPPLRRRKTGKARRLEIAQVAAGLFAKEGFAVSTRAIAEEIGISQAALYKHFRSKEALVAEVFQVCYLEDRESDFAELLASGSGDLSERLSTAYLAFFEEISETSLKLFLRAAWDGIDIARQYSPHLDERILFPVIEALRFNAGQPSLVVERSSSDERELALMLHSSIVFLAIRKHVYGVNLSELQHSIIQLQVDTWVNGASQKIRELNLSRFPQ